MKKISLVFLVSVLSAISAHAAPIHDAVRAGDLEQVKAIIDVDPSQLYATDMFDSTPLHLAAREGHTNMVKFLAEKVPHEELYAKDVGGDTPLHRAAKHGHTGVVKYLSDKLPYEELCAKNDDNNTPLDLAASHVNNIFSGTFHHLFTVGRYKKIVKFLKQEIASRTRAGEEKMIASLQRIAPCKNSSVVKAIVAALKNEEDPVDEIALIQERLQNGCNNLSELFTGDLEAFISDRKAAKLVRFDGALESKDSEATPSSSRSAQ